MHFHESWLLWNAFKMSVRNNFKDLPSTSYWKRLYQFPSAAFCCPVARSNIQTILDTELNEIVKLLTS